MNYDKSQQLAREIIRRDKWWDILSRFIDVLRINIFMVDSKGLVILPPDESKYGGRFTADHSLGFDLLLDSSNIIKNFEDKGQYLESINRYDLHSFAIPIVVESKTVIAYMIVGPVILNRKMDTAEYESWALKYGANPKDLVNEIHELRVVSNVMIGSILDLLSEIVRDNIDLSIKEKELDQMKLSREMFPVSGKNNAAQEIYSAVRLDELLITLLDVALKMTNTESGSIMVLDDKQKDLMIKVSRGLNAERIEKSKSKMGEGIAGLAAKENQTFFIEGQSTDNRIAHLLKRSDIKESLVLPLQSKGKVFGVLNVSTRTNESKIKDNLDNLQYLAKLLSSAF